MSRFREQQGIALVMALGVLVVMTIVTVSLLTYSSDNLRGIRYQGARVTAYSLAEAGMNEALAVLNEPTNNALDTSLLPQTTSTYDGGTAVWSGTLDQPTSTWTITSTGNVANPTGAAEVTRTLSVHVAVTPTLSQTLNNQAWNYIYSSHSDGDPSTCDMTIQQSVDVATPLYVEGDLCLENTAKITSGPLVVKGKLTLKQSANAVGSSTAKINEAHIGLGCKWKNNPLHDPCLTDGSDNVWANTLDSTVPDVSPPTVDWDGWYATASPGPSFDCVASQSSASTTWPVFDNDATRNNSVATPWDLTPSTAYDCWTAGGELKWDPTTDTLTVNGTVFIDGSAYIDNGATNRYSGEGSLYLSGTFLLKNSNLCAVVVSGDCDTANWDPNTNALIIVTNGNADNGLPSGDGVELVSAHFQGGVYATNAVDVTTTSWINGPIVGSTVKLGQSSTTSFPFITFVPTGTPGNPIVYAQPLPPTGYDG